MGRQATCISLATNVKGGRRHECAAPQSPVRPCGPGGQVWAFERPRHDPARRAGKGAPSQPCRLEEWAAAPSLPQASVTFPWPCPWLRGAKPPPWDTGCPLSSPPTASLIGPPDLQHQGQQIPLGAFPTSCLFSSLTSPPLKRGCLFVPNYRASHLSC